MITKFVEDMGKAFTHTNISEDKMSAILRNNGIFESKLAHSATSMTLGEMFDNIGKISDLAANTADDVARKSYQELILGLAKYPTKYLDDAGGDNAGSFVRFMAHGRRFELDFTIAKGAGYQANRNITLTGVGGRYIANSDIDGFMNGVAYSLKRQGKTLDNWVEGKSDEWLMAWFNAAADAADGSQIKFIIGGGQISAFTELRLDEVLEQLNKRRNPIIQYTVEVVPLKPPPAITP